MAYTFTAVWKAGKMHHLPYALSRAPVGQPSLEDEEAEREIVHQTRSTFFARIKNEDGDEETASPMQDIILEKVREASRADEAYQKVGNRNSHERIS